MRWQKQSTARAVREDTMWDWLATNWTMILMAIVVLACPLMHFFGHSHGTGRPHGHREQEHRS